MRSEALLHEMGAMLWPMSYKKHPNDDMKAWAASYEALERMADEGAPRIDRVTHGLYAECAAWVDGGCRILTTDDTYFSAMAKTSVSEDAFSELRIPWRCFGLRIPPGLLVTAGGERPVFALFGAYAHKATINVYGDDDMMAIGGGQFGGSLAELLFREEHADIAINIIARACAGLLYTMQHTNNWHHARSTFARVEGNHRAGPPTHRCIVIGRPLAARHDMRSFVRADVAAGKHVSSAFQVQVRGHIKRQVVGVGRAGRKVIWIEPYWRGPEDAPILARPHHVGSAVKRLLPT